MLESENYTVGWICALPLEMAAALALLDEDHGKPTVLPDSDHNQYRFGSIGAHGVIIACLPSGVYGTTSAATVAAHMLSTFPSIRIGLMVGIGGGVPSGDFDIRLGDVVISKPGGTLGGVVQYGMGKTVPGEFKRTGSLNKPPQELLTELSNLEADHMNRGNKIVEFLNNMSPQSKRAFPSPEPGNDQLFEADYTHPQSNETCESCDPTRLKQRSRRISDKPQVYFGVIASANQVMKDGIERDRLAKELGIICFEMEAAGLMDTFPCLVIRGICDYADSHKSKEWQKYAAVTAAACAKEILYSLPKRGAVEMRFVREEQMCCTIAAKERSPYPLFSVPYPRNSHFTGRRDVITEIEGALKEQQRVAITGVGGVGKTQIAVEYCYRFKERHRDRNVIWVSAGNRERLVQAYTTLAERLKLPKIDNEVNRLQQISEKLKDGANGHWLMVLDGADEYETFVDEDPALSFNLYIPENAACSVLITTRDNFTGKRLTNAETINVQCPTTEDSERLFRSKLARQEAVEQPVVSKLVSFLGNLPLAITHAAAFVDDNRALPLTKYVELLQKTYDDQKALLDGTLTSLKLSIDRLSRSAPHATELLCFMAILERQEIPKQLLMKEYQIEAQLLISIGRLKSASLITADSDDGTFTMHQLVQLAVRDWLENRKGKELYHSRAAARLLDDFPDAEYENRLACARLFPHVKAVIDYHCIASPAYAKLLHKAAQYQLQQEQFRAAFKYAQEAYNLHRELLGENTPETITSLALLAKAQLDSGNYRQAQEMQEKVLSGNAKLFGAKDPATLSSMNDLGLVLRRECQYSRAEYMHREALTGRRHILPEDHEDTLRSLDGLGVVLADQKRYKEAEDTHRQALEAKQRVLGELHPLTLVSMDNLASVLADQGELDEAKAIYQSALIRYTEILGDGHSDTISCLNNLACVLLSLDDYEGAEIGYQQAAIGYRNIFGEQHQYTLVAMQNLALTMVKQGKHSEAEKVCKEAFAITQKHRGNESPDALVWLQYLGMSLDRQGKYTEAESIYRQALRGWDKQPNDGKENVDMCLTCLVKVLGSQEKTEEARKFQAQLSRRRKVTGSQNFVVRLFWKLIDPLSPWTAESPRGLIWK